MEPAGLAVGVMGLLGLFSSCMDTLEKIDSYKEFGNDSHYLSTQFKADKLRLQNWGAAVGLRQGSLQDKHHKMLDDAQILSTVQELLLIIKNIDQEDAASFQSKLSGKPKNNSLSNTLNLPTESRTRKLRWALRQKAKRVEQVQRLGTLVQSLCNLVPTNDNGKFEHHTYINRGAPTFELQELLDRLEKDFEGGAVQTVNTIYKKLTFLADERREIHTWLNSKYAPNDLYEISVRSRLQGTCDWILGRPVFQNWASDDFESETSKLLWINGPPGFGKTILCSRILEHLRSTLETPVAHFFFSSDFESREDPFAAMQSWISQLMLNSAAFAVIRKKWTSSYQPPTRSTVVELFQELVKEIPHCTFVIDGLDECTSLTMETTAYEKEPVVDFLMMLKVAITRSESRVLIVSRDERDIRIGLTTDCPFEYKITPEDVQPDTAMYSRRLVDEKLPNKSEATRDDISLRMTNRCEGQFLWLKMQGRDLRGGKNKKQLLDAIDQTPSGLERLYNRNWGKIRASREAEKERAISILRWAAFALRPLTVREITEAVLIRNDSEILVEEMPEPIDEEYIKTEIIDICASLVEVRNTNSKSEDTVGLRTLHLTHHSVKQYFANRLSYDDVSLKAHKLSTLSTEAYQNNVLAKLCLQYVNMPTIWKLPAEDADQVIGVFRQYAAISWYQHIYAAGFGDPEVISLTISLFDEENPVWSPWRQLFDLESNTKLAGKQFVGPLYYASRLGLADTVRCIVHKHRRLHGCSYSAGSALWVASEEGHLSVVEILLENGGDKVLESQAGQNAISVAAQNGQKEVIRLLHEKTIDFTIGAKDGKTPLHIASIHGHLEVVTLLLKKGADITAADNIGWTPVNSASSNGHLEVVKLLLKKGADITVPSNNGWTPISSASANGHLEVVKLLLEKGADIKVANNDGWTNVNFASSDGHLEVVKLLLEKGADIIVASNNGWTPVNSASSNGHLEVVKLLLEQGADILVPYNDGWTPVNSASANGHLDVVKLLLEKGAEIGVPSNNGWTPVNSASSNGHMEVVKLLLEKGADITVPNNDGWTPVNSASYKGHLEVVKLLLEKGADIDIVDNEGWTTVNVASSNGYLEVVTLLLEKGADSAVPSKNGWTPVNSASYKGHLEVVKLLLEKGVDIMVPNNSGWTPVNSASDNGHLEIVKLLLEKGADITVPSNNGWTPVNSASDNGHLEVVKLLLEKGANVTVPNSDGWTPVNVASANGHLEVVKLLLEKGANVTVPNSDGWTPVNVASANGHLEVVKLLLEKGANVTVPNSDGWTPINSASYKGHLEVVKLLLEKGADIVAPSHDGQTPIITAASGGYMQIVQILLQHEQSSCANEDNNGRTAVFHAARCGHEAIVQLLAESNAAGLLTADHYGSIPLHTAVRNGHEKVVEYLLATFKASNVLQDSFGKPLGWWANKSGHNRILELVLEYARVSQTKDSGAIPPKVSPVVYKKTAWWCDICTICIRDGDPCYQCNTCDGGHFVICLECVEMDMKCQGSTHSWIKVKAPMDTSKIR